MPILQAGIHFYGTDVSRIGSTVGRHYHLSAEATRSAT